MNYENVTGEPPFTEADLLVDRFLIQEMRRLRPEAAWLSEESTDSDARLANQELIVVDPIDGTTAFARGDARWAISIAYVLA
ncbi:MAG: inositol monophosphatase family protein, partial [Sphaerospermopsis kisseleviana]